MDFVSVDLDELLSQCKKCSQYDYDRYFQDPDKIMQMQYGTVCLKRFVPSDFRLGIHTNGNDEVRRCYDYVFDIKDKDGQLILPFTASHPLFIVAARLIKLEYVFPVLEEAQTMKVGVLDPDFRLKVVKHPFEQFFDEFHLEYDTGVLHKTNYDGCVIKDSVVASTMRRLLGLGD
jgi:hypothetical protein